MSATKPVTFVIKNTCFKTGGEKKWQFRILVAVDRKLENLIQKVDVLLPPAFGSRPYELSQSHTDSCLYESVSFKSATAFEINIRVYLQNGALYLRADGKKKKTIIFVHELQFSDGLFHTSAHSADVVTRSQIKAATKIQGLLRGARQRRATQEILLKHYLKQKKKSARKKKRDPLVENESVGETSETANSIPPARSASFRRIHSASDASEKSSNNGKPLRRSNSLRKRHSAGEPARSSTPQRSSSLKNKHLPNPRSATPRRNASGGKRRRPPPKMWCITYQQLMDLDGEACSIFGAEDYPTVTMRDICRVIIEPLCAELKTSYALSLNKKGIPIQCFVSHGWDGYFAAFVQSIRNAFQTTMKKPNLWICAFALVQSQDEDLIQQQIGSSEEELEKSPFVQAIQAASSYCVVRNSNVDIWTRCWCVCETMYANHFGLLPDRTHITGPDKFAHLQTSVLDAQASRLKDRDRILTVLLTKFNREKVDNFVHELRTQNAPVLIEDEEDAPPEDVVGLSDHSDVFPGLKPGATRHAIIDSILPVDAPLDKEFENGRYGSKLPLGPPHDGEYKKQPNEAHKNTMKNHVYGCGDEGCRKLWSGTWGCFIGGADGKECFDLTWCKEGRKLNEMTGWDYANPRC